MFDGVGVRVAVNVAIPEGDGGDEGEGWADTETEKLGGADREGEKEAEGLVAHESDAVGASVSAKQLEAPGALLYPGGHGKQL